MTPDSKVPRDRDIADEAIATIEQQFATMYGKMKSGMRERAARVHAELQPLGYNLLRALVRCGPTHATAVAELLSLDKSIVSRQVRILEELGLVERQPDAADRRATYLAATPMAIERVTEVRLADQARLYESMRDWNLPDLEKFGELLAKINDTVA